MNDCCMCLRTFHSEPVVIVLTEEERRSFQALDIKPPRELVYCRPCIETIQDKQQGAQILKGLYQMTLTAAGVPNADRISSNFFHKLIERASAERPS